MLTILPNKPLHYRDLHSLYRGTTKSSVKSIATIEILKMIDDNTLLNYLNEHKKGLSLKDIDIYIELLSYSRYVSSVVVRRLHKEYIKLCDDYSNYHVRISLEMELLRRMDIELKKNTIHDLCCIQRPELYLTRLAKFLSYFRRRPFNDSGNKLRRAAILADGIESVIQRVITKVDNGILLSFYDISTTLLVLSHLGKVVISQKDLYRLNSDYKALSESTTDGIIFDRVLIDHLRKLV